MKKLNKRNAESFNSVETYETICICYCYCVSTSASVSLSRSGSVAIFAA